MPYAPQEDEEDVNAEGPPSRFARIISISLGSENHFQNVNWTRTSTAPNLAQHAASKSVQRLNVLSSAIFSAKAGEALVDLKCETEWGQQPDYFIRWTHIQRDVLDFREFAQITSQLPGLSEDLALVADFLLNAVQRDQERPFVHGKYLKPCSVRCDGLDPSNDTREAVSATFVCTPYFSFETLQRAGHDVASKESSRLHPMRTLLQRQFDWESTVERDSSQCLRSDGAGSATEFLHVPDLWCLVLGSSHIVSSCHLSIEQLMAPNIIKQPKPASDEKGSLVQVSDPYKRQYFFPLEDCRTFFELKQLISIKCLKDIDVEIDSCELILAQTGPLTAFQWIHIVDSQSSMLIQISVKIIKKNPPPTTTDPRSVPQQERWQPGIRDLRTTRPLDHDDAGSLNSVQYDSHSERECPSPGPDTSPVLEPNFDLNYNDMWNNDLGSLKKTQPLDHGAVVRSTSAWPGTTLLGNYLDDDLDDYLNDNPFSSGFKSSIHYGGIDMHYPYASGNANPFLVSKSPMQTRLDDLDRADLIFNSPVHPSATEQEWPAVDMYRLDPDIFDEMTPDSYQLGDQWNSNAAPPLWSSDKGKAPKPRAGRRQEQHEDLSYHTPSRPLQRKTPPPEILVSNAKRGERPESFHSSSLEQDDYPWGPTLQQTAIEPNSKSERRWVFYRPRPSPRPPFAPKGTPSEQMTTRKTTPEQEAFEQKNSEHSMPRQTLNESTKPKQIATEQMATEQMATGQKAPEQTAAEPTVSGAELSIKTPNETEPSIKTSYEAEPSAKADSDEDILSRSPSKEGLPTHTVMEGMTGEAMTEQTTTGQTTTGQTATGQTATEQTETEQAAIGQTISGQTATSEPSKLKLSTFLDPPTLQLTMPFFMWKLEKQTDGKKTEKGRPITELTGLGQILSQIGRALQSGEIDTVFERFGVRRFCNGHLYREADESTLLELKTHFKDWMSSQSGKASSPDTPTAKNAHRARPTGSPCQPDVLDKGLEDDLLFGKPQSSVDELTEIIVRFSEEVVAHFAPISFEHELLRKVWGSLSSFISLVLRHATQNDPLGSSSKEPDSGGWTIDTRCVEELQTGLPTNWRAFNQCADCNSGKIYKSKTDARGHLLSRHFRAQLYTTVELDTMEQLVISGAALLDDQRLKDLQSLLQRTATLVENFHSRLSDMVGGLVSVTEGTSREPLSFGLPSSIVQAFKQFVRLLMVSSEAVAQVDEYFSHTTLGNFRLNGSKMTAFRDLITTLGKGAKMGISSAMKDVVLLIRSGAAAESISYTAVDAHYLAFTFLSSRMLQKPNSVDRLMDQYAKRTSRLRYQIYHRRPTKHLLADIQVLQEELVNIESIQDEQFKTLRQYFSNTDPSTFRVTNHSRKQVQQLQYEVFFQFHKASYEDSKLCSALRQQLMTLAVEARHQIEISQEDNSKTLFVFTVVTAVFLPLSFVTSYLGMNTADIRTMPSSQKVFWEAALPVTTAVVGVAVLAAYKGGTLLDWMVDLGRRLKDERYRQLRKPLVSGRMAAIPYLKRPRSQGKRGSLRFRPTAAEEEYELV